MNILLITDNFYPRKGGIAHALNSLCKSFHNKEHKLYVINPYYKEKRIFNIIDNKDYNLKEIFKSIKKKKFWYYTFHSIYKILVNDNIKLFHRINLILYLFEKPKLLFSTINNINKISPIVRKLNIDIILSGHCGNILPLSFILSKSLNTKIIAIAHGLDFMIQSYFSLKTFYLKNLDKIIVTNNRNKYFIKKIHELDEKKIAVIYLGLITHEYEINETKAQLRKKFDISPDSFVLLSVGRHTPRKKFDLVIRAIYEIIKLKPELKIKYYLIGEGPITQELKLLTKKLNLDKYVNFLGYCDHLKRNKYYKLSDLFLMPSIVMKNSFEGFGIVFLEANYFKLPVIGAYSGGVVEAIIDGKTGFLIKPNNLNDLVEKISFLYKNKKEREIIGENGYKRVLIDFNWDYLINEYVNLFKNVLNS
ncbi:MAG: glycosyltransferase family 4 protein [Promethearchaeota archaeon]